MAARFPPRDRLPSCGEQQCPPQSGNWAAGLVAGYARLGEETLARDDDPAMKQLLLLEPDVWDSEDWPTIDEVAEALAAAIEEELGFVVRIETPTEATG